MFRTRGRAKRLLSGGLLLTLCDVALVSVGFSSWATSQGGIGPFFVPVSVEVGPVIDEGGLFSFHDVSGFSLCQDGIVDGSTKTIVDSATIKLTLEIDCAKARDAGYVTNDVFSASFVLETNNTDNPNLLNFVSSLTADESALTLTGVIRDATAGDGENGALTRSADYSLASFPATDTKSIALVYALSATYVVGGTTHTLSSLYGKLPSLKFIVKGGTA